MPESLSREGISFIFDVGELVLSDPQNGKDFDYADFLSFNRNSTWRKMTKVFLRNNSAQKH